MAAKRRTKAHIPKQILDAIERVWPDGVVEMSYDFIEDSYFHELYPKVHRSLSSIRGASLRYEQEAEERRQGEDNGSDIQIGPTIYPLTTERTPITCFSSPQTINSFAMKLRPRSLTKKTRM
jgi:hypothetical protein